MVDDATDRERNLVPAAQQLLGAPHVRRDGVQLLLGSVEQFAALARPLLCERRIAADHEALARIVGRGDLGKVALIRQRGLDGAHLDQAADRRPTRRDPVEPGRLDGLLKPRRGRPPLGRTSAAAPEV